MPDVPASAAEIVALRTYLATKMNDKKLSQEALGKLCDVGQVAISHYERGRRCPESPVAKRLVALARRYKYPRTGTLLESLL